MFQYIKNLWWSVSLKKKLGSYTVMVILVMALSVAFNIYVMNFALGSFNVILDDNSKCHDFQEALEVEIKAFETYARERTEENREEYVLACVRSERCLLSLPFDYGEIGSERYARTWNIKNSYENYSTARDAVLQMSTSDKEYIPSLYKIYNMQSYIQTYVRRLVQVTLKEGNASYQDKVSVFYNMPYLILVFSVVVVVLAVCITRILSNTLINPLIKLAHSSRKIGKNDFSEPDMVTSNKDEVGELVRAFNKMKHSTEGYINTLKKNNEMAQLLQEELEKMEMEKRLDAARMELLKSQINPHFLFNTLNMIACTAKLEDASTTERMINSMSNLFRYNLKTSEQIVPLALEMKVVRDYLYIQQMRFGNRIQFKASLKVDENEVMVPAFTLQPVVENAIIHGLSKKEQGGMICLRVWQEKEHVVISVADTGVGMDEESLRELLTALTGSRTARVGIGVGNIYQRIHTMYPDGGDLKIYSKKDKGTVIQMIIPQDRQAELVWEKKEEQACTDC